MQISFVMNCNAKISTHIFAEKTISYKTPGTKDLHSRPLSIMWLVFPDRP